MNKEALQALKARAERATTLAAEIEALYALQSWKVRHMDAQGNVLIEQYLLKDVIGAGVKAVVAAKEKELEAIVGQPAAPDVTVVSAIQVPVFPLPSDVTCTAQQPAQPFAEVTCAG